MIKHNLTKSDYYVSIVNSSEDLIIGVSTGGIIESFNPAAEEILGYREEEICGLPFFELIPDEFLENEKVLLGEVGKGIRLKFGLHQLKTKEGKILSFNRQINPLKGPGNHVGGLVNIFRPDPFARSFLDAVQDTNHPLRQFLDNAPVAVYACDHRGRIIQFNKVAARLWGREPKLMEDLWCGSWKIFTTEGEEMDPRKCPMAVALDSGKPVYGEEIVIQRPDGSRFNVLPHPLPIKNSNGEVLGAINILMDVTHHKFLRNHNSWLAAIIDSTDDAIVSKTLDGIITSWNPSAERIFGYTAEEMIGSPVTCLIPAELQDEEPKILAQLKKGQRVDHFDTRRMTKDGRLIDVSLTISPIRSETGQIVGASKIARDVTDRKNSQIQLEEKTRSLEKINEELNQFAYIISHDLKAPLRAISSISHFLISDYNDVLGEGGREMLEILDGRIKRMSGLIQGLLDYSRVGKTRSRIEEQNVNDLVREIWVNISPDPHIRLEMEEIPPVYFEKVPLVHVLQNLISNAVKFMDKPQGLIKVAVERKEDFLQFSVSDNGPGIEKQYHNRVFKIFQTINPRDEIESTGIGLTIVKKIVENYEGEVWLESAPLKGTTVYFTLPRYSGEQDAQER